MRKVLVIESEQSILATLAEELEQRGVAVDPATNGGEALHKLWNKPDLIVLDGLLSDIDGLALLAQIKNDLVVKNVPVILLLEAGDEAKAHVAAELGVSKSVIKTHYSLGGLCDLIVQYISKEEQTKKKSIVYV